MKDGEIFKDEKGWWWNNTGDKVVVGPYTEYQSAVDGRDEYFESLKMPTDFTFDDDPFDEVSFAYAAKWTIFVIGAMLLAVYLVGLPG